MSRASPTSESAATISLGHVARDLMLLNRFAEALLPPKADVVLVAENESASVSNVTVRLRGYAFNAAKYDTIEARTGAHGATSFGPVQPGRYRSAGTPGKSLPLNHQGPACSPLRSKTLHLANQDSVRGITCRGFPDRTKKTTRDVDKLDFVSVFKIQQGQ